MGKECVNVYIEASQPKVQWKTIFSAIWTLFDTWTLLINEGEISELCKYSARQLLQVSFAKT